MTPAAGKSRSRVPAVIVHGGAGADPGDRDELRGGMRAAIGAAWNVLGLGGRALDAVEQAVRVLEDHPRFNAGRGSVLTAAGTVEMDASIMEGDRLECGAVAGVTSFAHPVTLARRVLESRRHVFIAGDGVREIAQRAGVVPCDPAQLITERQRERLARSLAQATAPDDGGTVGAVALDRHGTIAAATSTGGTAGKLPGRVGDSAIIGAGTYADSTLGGVSCTGDGEAVIRVVLARRTIDILKDCDNPDRAARVAVDLLVDEGRGQGGVILLDWRGRVGYAQSTPLMPVAWMSAALAEPELPF